LLLQLTLFAIPAVTAWASTLNKSAYLPLIALPVTLVVGLVMLTFRHLRRVGAHVVAGSLLAAVLEAGLALALIVAYAQQNPGWDLA
jgi:hypothetical protein